MTEISNRAMRTLPLLELFDGLTRLAASGSGYESVLNTLRQTLACSHALLLLEEDGGATVYAADETLPASLVRGVVSALGETSEVIVEDLARRDELDSLRAQLRAQQVQALALYPLVWNDAQFGMLLVAFRQPSSLSTEDENTLKMVAAQLAMIVGRWRSAEQVIERVAALEEQIGHFRQV
ncbi:MAG TPA: GAF domain-containing protein, partial [Candidatus Binatia bacterium]|nr:GAF domain-containing protein [Candidatus Binatia bacterium]